MAVVGTEAQIADALLWFVGQIATTPSLKIAAPSVAFSPSIGVPYLAVTVLPNTADLFGLEYDSDVDHKGLVQVSVFWPSGQGIIKPSQIAAQVVAALAPGTKIDRNGIRVRIDQQPTVASAQVESDWVQIPVTARWRAFVPSNASA